MEIERKYLIKKIPDDFTSYPHKLIKQGYLSTSPVIRIRQLGSDFILTIKGQGLLSREEYELSITLEQFNNLSKKVDGLIIHKTRYYIPFNKHIIELDIFYDEYDGLILAEVEFDSLEDANTFKMPDWFKIDVTEQPSYHNSNLSRNHNSLENLLSNKF